MAVETLVTEQAIYDVLVVSGARIQQFYRKSEKWYYRLSKFWFFLVMPKNVAALQSFQKGHLFVLMNKEA